MSEKKGILGLLGIDNIFESIKKLVDTRLQIIKLELKDDLAKFLANAFISIITINILLIAIMLISIGVSIYLGDVLGNYTMGFILVACFYLLIFFLLLIFRNKIGLKEFFEKELNKWLNIDN
ncbi:MAG: phage holin family protein [Fulvivirga sp.]|uniref:phage holin family protein n=1 Tax=Fulvivirga sp. TaxID=1931237 RepID=UPI0032F29347